MQKITAPFIRRLGVDIDGNIANTGKVLRQWMIDNLSIDVPMTTLLKVGVLEAYPILKTDEALRNKALNAPWKNPGAIELTNPRIPDLLREACFDGELIRYVPIGLSSTKGDVASILGWLREKDVPLEAFLHKKQQSAKADTAVDAQLEDSIRVAKYFGEAQKPVVLTSDASPGLQSVLSKYPTVHYSSWDDISNTLQRNSRLLRQLGILQELEAVPV